MYIGLSLLIASVSFLCYRHPPTTWSFPSWLRQRRLQPTLKDKLHNAPAAITTLDGSAESKEAPIIIEEPPSILLQEPEPVVKAQEDRIAMPPPPTKADQDRKAMPPPSFKIQKPSLNPPPPPDTPRAVVPSLELSDTAPMFPAANSAQRAGGRPPPPTFDHDIPSFPAANSAQRAQGGTGPPRLNPISPGLMAPPLRSPLPNRGPQTSSLTPPPSHTSIPTKPRRKVLLSPGHSPLDWARLTSSPSANLRGLPPATPYLRVPPSLLKEFTGRKGKDAWTVLGGKVYNVTPYLPYHPGGEGEVLRVAGKDGTRMFGEIHPWVNWEGMLEGCLVGIAVEEGEAKDAGSLEEMD